jgi:hypothetical protein
MRAMLAAAKINAHSANAEKWIKKSSKELLPN